MTQEISFRYPTALSVAGSDSSGGAGIQADLKTFTALGVYGCTAITAITAQNTQGVRGIQAVSPDILRQQLEAVFEDLTVDAVKIGMLFKKENIDVVAEVLDRYHPKWSVLDPVMISTSGRRLLEASAVRQLQEVLFPRVDLVTPNVDELAALTGRTLRTQKDLEQAGRMLLKQGCRALLIKGGHWAGTHSIDLLLLPEQEPICYSTAAVQTPNTHGTGCTLSSAITAYLAQGVPLPEAIRQAKNYVATALATGADVMAGHGPGSLNHLFQPEPLRKIPSANP